MTPDPDFIRWYELTGCRTIGDSIDHARAGWDAARARQVQAKATCPRCGRIQDRSGYCRDCIDASADGAWFGRGPHEHGIEEP